MAFVKKYWWLLLVLAVLVGYLGYRGRHRIKSYLGMTPATTPATQTTGASVPSTSTATLGNIYTTKTDSVKGSYLADFNGMSLYVFDNDLASGASTCYSSCATKWPAYTSGATVQSSLPANITVMTRTDGTSQFAWKGRPLYYYYQDKNAGDVLGDGIGGIWHLVSP